MQKHEILVLSIANPLLVGVYKDKNLIKTYSLEGKTSDIIAKIFTSILKEYPIKRIYYINGPGSFMAIKVSYVFLKTLSIVQDIELLAVSGFEFNQNSPIKALGNRYFMQKDGKIVISALEDEELFDFVLPKTLVDIKSSFDNLPNYILPAV
ncbi:MAG: hypothetical protein GX118_00985 [Arcobacter butzleri]|jgi:tRNA A37 threonylcarbamoyladenosine modification protein TsaB|nr:hypothetical protein [Arcobacteraceae bacterium]MDY0365179.1 hypothetical protein [Arcobacteraceae bacterium]NLO16758.1 hypothetical protein [Aliarcobacter butzleri]